MESEDSRENSFERSDSPITFYLQAQDFYLKEFILNFEQQPVLWDSTNIHYRDQAQRLKALEKLTTIYQNILPNATIEDTRKKINSLRSNYRKELRKVTHYTEKDNCYVSQSWIFHMMKFLNKSDKAAKHSNKSQERENSTEEYSSPNVCYVYGPPKAEERHVVNGKKELDVKSTILLQEADSTDDTSIDPVALYWSNKLEQLDQHQRIYAEKAISDVLFEAELESDDEEDSEVGDHSYMSDDSEPD